MRWAGERARGGTESNAKLKKQLVTAARNIHADMDIHGAVLKRSFNHLAKVIAERESRHRSRSFVALD